MPEPMNRKQITEELENLQLEEARERMEATRQARAYRLRRIQARDRDVANDRMRRRAAKEACWHKKGGKGVTNLAHGNDHNYAVVKHILSHGPTIVICQRCLWVWEAPDVALRRGTAAERELYRVLWEEYQWALNLPTDNETSGTQLFVIAQDTTPPTITNAA